MLKAAKRNRFLKSSETFAIQAKLHRFCPIVPHLPKLGKPHRFLKLYRIDQNLEEHIVFIQSCQKRLEHSVLAMDKTLTLQSMDYPGGLPKWTTPKMDYL